MIQPVSLCLDNHKVVVMLEKNSDITDVTCLRTLEKNQPINNIQRDFLLSVPDMF